MRPIILLAIPMLCLTACDQSPKALLGGGAWTCATDGFSMTLAFGGGGKLTGDIKLDDESSPDGLHVKLKTSGSWTLEGESDLSFTFTDVSVTEAKRGGQSLDQVEAEYFKGVFSDSEGVKAKVASISGNKLVLTQEGEDDLTCTR